MSPQSPTRIPLIHNYGLHITLHNTQNVGPINCCSPPPFALACCSSILHKYSMSIVLLSLLLCDIDLGMKVTLLKNVLHLKKPFWPFKLWDAPCSKTIAYFFKHDFIKLFQLQHNGDSTYKSKQRQEANISILDIIFSLLPRVNGINNCIASRLLDDLIKHSLVP